MPATVVLNGRRRRLVNGAVRPASRVGEGVFHVCSQEAEQHLGPLACFMLLMSVLLSLFFFFFFPNYANLIIIIINIIISIMNILIY